MTCILVKLRVCFICFFHAFLQFSMGFDYPWHPDFLWWFVMLVVGPRPSLFWRRTRLHHLGYLSSFISLSYVVAQIRQVLRLWNCWSHKKCLPCNQGCRPDSKFKELAHPQLWFYDLDSGHFVPRSLPCTYPFDPFCTFLLRLCMQCRKCLKSKTLLPHGDSPSNSS